MKHGRCLPLGVAAALLSAATTVSVLRLLAPTAAFVPSPGLPFSPPPSSRTRVPVASGQDEEVSAREALERTRKQLEAMQAARKREPKGGPGGPDPRIEKQTREYLSFPANALKQELKANGLPTKGRKPDLARRLAEFEYLRDHPDEVLGDEDEAAADRGEASQRPTKYLEPRGSEASGVLETFCGMGLSEAAGAALGRAGFDTPTPIQRKSLRALSKGNSAVLHAETGSGKTLAYLLPITEAMWRDQEEDESGSGDDEDLWYGIVLTPTRELAAQVAGVASVLAPPGSVRLVSRPTNLLSEGRYWKERRGTRVDDPGFLSSETELRGRGSPPRLFVGSAKAIMGSLYGDGKMPASPTRKPAAKELLSRTRWIVMDEVDRLLSVKSKKGLSAAQRQQVARKNAFQYGETASGKKRPSKNTGPLHEKPAAVLASAIARRTFGRAQVISASATVGRGLKRELSRVLGLPPKEYPRVIRGDRWDSRYEIDEDGYDIDDDDNDNDKAPHKAGQGHVDRAVTIPSSVSNYLLPVEASTVGKLLTSACFAIKNLNDSGNKPQKILVVLTKNCGVTTANAIGALKHLRCQPEPRSLLDVLQNADGNDQLMDVHRRVSGSDGVGEESSYFSRDRDDGNDDDDDETSSSPQGGEGYVMVTGEDTVRGMHLAGLDTVVVVGMASGPDEYIHIAGRTGRAGKNGRVINVLSEAHTRAIKGWEKMLSVGFETVSMEDTGDLE
ncbi:unnamed protein product [Pseudo-nitzschia multistriata]|uniref:RNA helicase n=1 Tax=Pseudo-nitzschia multistriata TaxID=183589 RepID=A0A448Z9Y6_9STRA|nr:unnamed protein product [Pseudo-nitzschia multistriata]